LDEAGKYGSGNHTLLISGWQLYRWKIAL
jgi:hypothetical protein